MCASSMVGDHYNDMWRHRDFYPAPAAPLVISGPPEITKAEFDELKRQVLEMKELLKRAIKYDKDNGEPECEIEEKMEILRKIAQLVGVNLDDVIGKRAAQ